MPSFDVRQAQTSDQHEIAQMCALLWPDSSIEEHSVEIGAVLHTAFYGTMPGTIFVSTTRDHQLIGFVLIGLRSHADGCNTAQPVGFVEGWFVHQAFRGIGIGRSLIQSAENWARRQGCTEIASDAWIDDTNSQNAHQALGFEIVDRCVHLRKTLWDQDTPDLNQPKHSRVPTAVAP
jgi:aminoglycoside 6'-N-acetyltransferase I